jgi:hypothetical protein
MINAQCVTRNDLRELLARRSDVGILSIYLDGDDPGGPNRSSWKISHLRSGLKELGQSQAGNKALKNTIDLAFDEISKLPPKIRKRGLVYFRDAASDFTWWRSLQRPLSPNFIWMNAPYIRPLVTYLDDSPILGIILLSKEEIRLLTWRQGIISRDSEQIIRAEEESEGGEPSRAGGDAYSQRGASGADRLRIRMSQRARRLVADAAEIIPHTAVREGWERLALIGPSPLREVFQGQLLEPWRHLVIASEDKTMTRAGAAELSQTLESMVAAWNREREHQETEETYNLAKAGGRAVVGAAACLESLQQGRVARLYFASDVVLKGWRKNDGFLTLPARETEAEKGEEEPYLVERMVAMALETGADVRPVEGGAAARLKDIGGMEARLRY